MDAKDATFAVASSVRIGKLGGGVLLPHRLGQFTDVIQSLWQVVNTIAVSVKRFGFVFVLLIGRCVKSSY
jgi:hypothetical protein